MDIKPIKSATVQEQVYEELLQAIISGRIKPGEKITIESTAKLLQVSLMPVRVALQKLETGGFVTIGKNRRIMVNQLTPSGLKEIMELRLLVECYAAKKGCQLGGKEAADELERLNRECNQAPDSDSYIEANRKFHSSIYRRAGLPVLLDIIEQLWCRISPYLYILLRQEEEWRSGVYMENHQGMVRAMRDRDVKIMCRWLSSDLTHATHRIAQLLDQARGIAEEQEAND